MFSSDHKVVHHAKRVVAHVKKHQHTYLFFGGLAGGVFLITKIVMLFATSYMFYNISHDVSFAEDIVLTGEVETGTVEEEPVVETGTVEEEPVVETGTVEEEPVVETGTVEEEPVVETGTVEEEPVVETGTVEEEPVVETGTVEEEYGFQTTETCNYLGFSTNVDTGIIYSGLMNLSWTISSACDNEVVDIQLYDHNEEWITLASVSGTTTEYVFDTTLLGSGFYTQTGTNLSGETIVIFTGIYSGISMNSWTGYHFRWLVQPDTILSETTDFIIDNQEPTISDIVLSSSGSLSGIVGVGKEIIIKFNSSELLTGISVLIDTGEAIFSNLSGMNYTYSYVLTGLGSKYISYSISYQDFAGFTGYVAGTSQLFYDSIFPQITQFSLSGYDFSFVTSELTNATSFLLFKNTTNGWSFSMTGESTGHNFSLPTLSLGTDYDMGIIVKDLAGNESKAALSLNRNMSGNISFTLLATLYGQILTTYSSGVNFLSTSGSIQSTGIQEESILEDFKDEIDKFTECKDDIEYTKIKLQIKGTEIVLNMPTFIKSEMKKLVNSFILYILNSLEKAPLSEAELQDIAQNFDNFSVILKLLKDDDNSCKQNLSNYHLEQFKQSLETYGINLL